MTKTNYYILIFTLLLTVPLFAQRETVNWYFGSNSGLDFNSGNAQVLSGGQLSTTEGCSTVSDNNGSLLFYTNGVEIWNKNHDIMQNGSGLLGSDSSSQSAIVVPNVSNPNNTATSSSQRPAKRRNSNFFFKVLKKDYVYMCY